MTVVRVKGFKIFKDRHGKQRCYHRASGIAVDLTKAPLGSIEFVAECARVSASKTIAKPKGGTLGALIAAYRTHKRFTVLKHSTRIGYEVIFTWLRAIEDLELSQLDRKTVVKIRDRADATKGWHFANRAKLVMSVLFSWGAERGYVPFNYAAEIRAIPRPKDLDDLHRRWTDMEQEVVLDACSPVMKPVIGLMMFLGLGPGDAIKLPRNKVKDWKIESRRAKTGKPFQWPLPGELVAIMKDAPRHDAVTLVASSRGMPWTKDGFNTVWQRLKSQLVEAELIGSDLTLYGLRHSQAELLAELGFDSRTIADALGQATEGMALRYSRKAKLGQKMEEVVRKTDAERAKRGTRFVKPDENISQTAETGTKRGSK